MELLAPARDLDTLKAAFDAGADAVYLGLKDFSARKRAKNFTLEELLIADAIKRQLKKKLYVAINTLIFQDELQKLIQILAFLETIKIDAIIIQDYGVYELVKTFSINIPLHASTQMGTKNHFQTNFLKKLGFKRVVLERQLTLSEIENIKKHSDIELEVFIHGAMCFSLSGLCFFSKAFADRSGNRGDCAQPCRWAFLNKAYEAIQPFSMKDLNGLSLVPALMKLGITSIKIEGRMKGVDYVYPVVSAYRKLIDYAKKGDVGKNEIDKIERELENATLSRISGTGFFFFDKTNQHRLSTGHTSEEKSNFSYPANTDLIGEAGTGQYVGKVKNVTKTAIFFNTHFTLNVGDTLRIDNPKGDERYKIPVKAIYLNKEKTKTASPGSFIGIPSNEQRIKMGFVIYLVHRRYSYKPKKISLTKIEDVHCNQRIKVLQKLYNEVIKDLPGYKGEVKRHIFNPEQEIYCIANHELFFITPNIYENHISLYNKIEERAVTGLIISHPSEVTLSLSLPKYTSFFLPATNAFAIRFFQRLKVKALSISPDLSEKQFNQIKDFFPFWIKWQNTPLCISRVPVQEGCYRLKSLKNKNIVVNGIKGGIYLY